MSLMESIQKAEKRPPIITLVGDAGTGKSSLAASFPKPIFIRAEDGANRISRKVGQPDCFPALKNGEDIFEQLKTLYREEHAYETLVIDSVSKLDELFTQEILAADPEAKGLNQALGGYGSGAAAVAAKQARVRKACNALNDKGMAIVFLAHAALESLALPDTEDYQRHSLAMLKKSIPFYRDDVDMVAYVRLELCIAEGAKKAFGGKESKRVIGDGGREIACYASPASIAKNGYGITKPLPFIEGENPLLPFLMGTENQTEAE